MTAVYRHMEEESQRVRYNIKDSIFITFFREPKNVLELYRETHPEDMDVVLEDIKMNTLKNVVLTGPVNDLGFIVKDRMMFLVEAQSYYMPSVLLRSFVYLLHTLERYLKEKGIDINYAQRSEVPNWTLYIIFTKGSRYKDRDEVVVFDSMGSDFFDLSNGRTFELKKGGILEQYLEVCSIIDRVITEYGHGKDAVEKIFESCEGCEGILCEFIQSRRMEIMGLYEEMFDEEEVARIRMKHMVQEALEEATEEAKVKARAEGLAEGRAEGRVEGLAEGRAEGRAEGLAMGKVEGIAEAREENRQAIRSAAVKLIELGTLTDEQIADVMGMSVEEVRALRSD